MSPQLWQHDHKHLFVPTVINTYREATFTRSCSETASNLILLISKMVWDNKTRSLISFKSLLKLCCVEWVFTQWVKALLASLCREEVLCDVADLIHCVDSRLANYFPDIFIPLFILTLKWMATMSNIYTISYRQCEHTDIWIKAKNSPLTQSWETYSLMGLHRYFHRGQRSQLFLWSCFRRFASSLVNLLRCMFCIIFANSSSKLAKQLLRTLIIDGGTTAKVPFTD